MAIQSPFFIANNLVQYPTAVIECEPHRENVFRDTSEFLDYVVANIKALYYMPMVLIAFQYIIIIWIWETVSFELGKEIEKDVFRLVTSVGPRKHSESPWGIEPHTIGFRRPML